MEELRYREKLRQSVNSVAQDQTTQQPAFSRKLSYARTPTLSAASLLGVCLASTPHVPPLLGSCCQGSRIHVRTRFQTGYSLHCYRRARSPRTHRNGSSGLMPIDAAQCTPAWRRQPIYRQLLCACPVHSAMHLTSYCQLIRNSQRCIPFVQDPPQISGGDTTIGTVCFAL